MNTKIIEESNNDASRNNNSIDMIQNNISMNDSGGQTRVNSHSNGGRVKSCEMTAEIATIPKPRRRIINLVKSGTLDQKNSKDKVSKHFHKKLQKLSRQNKSIANQYHAQIMPGSGAMCYTNY